MLKFRHQLNDPMKPVPLFLYGAQWWLSTMPMVVIIGVIAGSLHETTFAGQSWYMQKMFIAVGLTMLVQVTLGHGLPLIAGPATVLFVGLMASSSSSIEAMYTAMGFGALCMAALGASGLLKKILPLFTPRVVSLILILIPLSLTPFILRMILGNGENAVLHIVFAAGLVLFLLMANQHLPGMWKSTTLVWGTIGGSLLYVLLSGVTPPALLQATPQLSAELISLGVFVPGLEWDTGPVLAFLICFLALLINELGSMESVGYLLGAQNMGKRIMRGTTVSGACNAFSSLTGVMGCVDYSFSSGIIAATGCASRFPIIPAAIGLMLCAFFPRLIQLFLSIPSPVLGGLILYFMSSQLSAGFGMIVQEKAVHSFSSGVVCGLPILTAVMVAFAPPAVIEQFPKILKPMVGNGFVIGALAVLVLEHLIFPQRKNAGATPPGV